jgi:hypothetical protein
LLLRKQRSGGSGSKPAQANSSLEILIQKKPGGVDQDVNPEFTKKKKVTR